MIERTVGYISDYDGESLTVIVPYTDDRKLLKQGITECEVTLTDGRSISAAQRKKAYATIADIAAYSGDVPEYVKEHLKWLFCMENGIDGFSLSDCDMSTAREFISYVLEFAILWGVPLSDLALKRTDDIGRYLYFCLENRVCAVCGKRADVHHVDRVGLGRDRKTIIHTGMRAEALCREHHGECHTIGQATFDEKYHIYGIELDEWLCGKLGLNTKAD